MKIEVYQLQILISQIMEQFINVFKPMLQFYTPWKYQKTIGSLTFSGGYRSGTLAWNGLKMF